MLGKKGQTEDFLADFLPAAVLIVISLVVGSVLSASNTDEVESKVNLAAVRFNGMDAFALLHSPVEGYPDFAGLLVAVAEAYEKRDLEFFEKSGMARLGSEYAECSEGFEGVMNRFFVNKGWTISVFEALE